MLKLKKAFLETESFMKILIASDSYKYQTSGASNVVIAMADELRRRGQDVKILAMSNRRESFKDGDDYYIKSLPGLVYPDARFSPVIKDPLLKELKEWRPDIIHMHTEMSAARMARSIAAYDHTPYIMTSHTDYGRFVFGHYCNLRPVRMLCKEVGRIAYRNAAVVTVPSSKALSFPQLNTLSDRVVVIPNGISLEKYGKRSLDSERQALFKQWGLKDNGHTIVMVTRISREKNINEIVSCFPAILDELPDAQLLIVGDGPEREKLENIVAESGISRQVTFTGRIPPEKVYMYYDMGDVFVSASTFEVHSLTYLEAMSHGLPLICRNDPCLKGVLSDGVNGYAYRTRSEFVDDVIRVLTHDQLRERMGTASLDKSQEFSVECCVDRMLELYKKVVDSRNSLQIDYDVLKTELQQV